MKNDQRDIKCSQFSDTWPSNKALFKYLKKEHADKLFKDGELLIGTLYDFRNYEQHGSKRGDAEEGKKEISEHVDNLVVKSPSEHNPLSPFVKKFINLEPGANNFQLSNCDFSVVQDCGNCYLYCMSSEFDEKLLQEFQADICIKIKKPQEFVEKISLALENGVKDVRLLPVIYGQRNQQYGKHDQYHASIIKPVNYKSQKEVRAIWAQKNQQDSDIKPLFIKLQTSDVTNLCEKI